MKAQRQQVTFPFNGQDVHLEPGQFVTGRDKACLELGLTPKKFRNALNYLENTQRTASKRTNRFSIITVLNWDIYQNGKSEKGQQKDQQRANRGPTKGQQRATYKKEEKVKKEENKKEIEFPKHLNTDEFRTVWESWVQFRKETKKPLTPIAIKQQIALLGKYELYDAIAIINKSIVGGWQGLFPNDTPLRIEPKEPEQLPDLPPKERIPLSVKYKDRVFDREQMTRVMTSLGLDIPDGLHYKDE
jgi:hypothetical protein